MHEGGFTQRIVDAILKELQAYPGRKVKRAAVKVGELFHLEPDSVRTHFRSSTKGTTLEGAELELKETPVSVLCRDCGKRGGVEDHHLLLCGNCGSLHVELIEGQEILLEEIDLESSI